jgi:hypothetical protein
MKGVTSIAQNHRHLFDNVTDLFIPGVGTHRHTFQGITNTTNGHRHNYSGTTGPAINGQGPNHFHRFRIQTRVANGHIHIISGRTTVPMFIGTSSTHRHGLIIEKIESPNAKVNKLI